jgi:hypothetical protein
MNERQAYEKHLADKLQQLPPPADMDRNWEQMRLLLDNDLPRGGGGWRNRWWITGMIAGLLLTGTWLLTQPFSANDRRQQPAAAAVTPTTDLPQRAHALPDASTPATGKQQLAAYKPAAATGLKPVTATGQPQDRETNPATTGSVANGAAPPVAEETITNDNQASISKDKAGTPTTPNDVVSTGEGNNNTPATEAPTEKHSKGIIAGKTKSYTNTSISGTVIAAGTKKQQTSIDEFTTHPSLVKHTTDDSGLQVQSPSRIITSTYTPAFTRADIPAAAKNTTPRFIRSKENKTFVVGLSLPLAFPLGDQKPLSYNSNAGANAVSDYIPSPHLQYHFNKKTYIQTEVQVFSPQYIRPILLFEQKQQLTPGNYLYSSIYARKLYYLNIPIGIHHSPFKNFYMGTGLQLSSMLSGIALQEERKEGTMPGQSFIVRQQYSRFSNDSLSGRFNGTEMRLLLDVNYYWQRFTVGLRYNQAFTNYVSFQVNNNAPYTYDKNKALQFYLRYNIWEDIKRKKNNSKSLLSLK